jgi:peptidoglycan-N-acetylglucosamine deacetylase
MQCLFLRANRGHLMESYVQDAGVTRKVILTFDDGPSPNNTPKVLKTLKEHNIKALFFIVGLRLKNPAGIELIRQAIEDGHIIANHTFTHPFLPVCSRIKIRDEILRTHELICRHAGDCRFFRPPFGAGGSLVTELTEELGYTQVFWNLDTMDWKYQQGGLWVEHAMSQVEMHNDNLILMHDIFPTTVEHLPSLLLRIRKIGKVEFVVDFNESSAQARQLSQNSRSAL